MTFAFFSVGIRDGMLMKRGRDNGQFLSRRFVLSEREGTLKYFTKYDVSIIKLFYLLLCYISRQNAEQSSPTPFPLKRLCVYMYPGITLQSVTQVFIRTAVSIQLTLAAVCFYT